MDEEISGFLEKLKSSGFSKLLGNTNYRFFQANKSSNQFGYRSDLRKKQFKKVYPLKSITEVIDNITPEERKLCKWKYGFKLKINNKITTFFAENASEKQKWVNFFQICLGLKSPTKTKSVMNEVIINKGNSQNKKKKINDFNNNTRSISQNVPNNINETYNLSENKKESIYLREENIQTKNKISKIKNINDSIVLDDDIIKNDDYKEYNNNNYNENFNKVNPKNNFKNYTEDQINLYSKKESHKFDFNFKAELPEFEDYEKVEKSKKSKNKILNNSEVIKEPDYTLKPNQELIKSNDKEEEIVYIKKTSQGIRNIKKKEQHQNIQKINKDSDIPYLTKNLNNINIIQSHQTDNKSIKENITKENINFGIIESSKIENKINKKNLIKEIKNFDIIECDQIDNNTNKENIIKEIKNFEDANNNLRSKLTDDNLIEQSNRKLIKISGNNFSLKNILHGKNFIKEDDFKKINDDETNDEKTQKFENIRKKLLEKNENTILINKANLNDWNVYDKNKNVIDTQKQDDLVIIQINSSKTKTENLNNLFVNKSENKEESKLNQINVKQENKNLDKALCDSDLIEIPRSKSGNTQLPKDNHKSPNLNVKDSLMSSGRILNEANTKPYEKKKLENKDENNKNQSIDNLNNSKLNISSKEILGKKNDKSDLNNSSFSPYVNDYYHKNTNQSIIIGNVDQEVIDFFNKPKPISNNNENEEINMSSIINKKISERKTQLGNLVFDNDNEEFEFKINKKIVEDFSQIKKRLLMEKSKFLKKESNFNNNEILNDLSINDNNIKNNLGANKQTKKIFKEEFENDWK